ncbi:MAG TPA: FAD-dependent oxidoreductase [bacterium]|nr:FAD-dependent oxidoreductase [bacterium]HPN34999.1 FAD-dependent oxidoreductase [bacterium]
MKTLLLNKKELCRGTWEFTLAKPADTVHQAGQHITVKLPRLLHEDPKGPQRTFTLASAPHEADWLIATRMTGSGFKKTLLDLPLNTELEVHGPMGALVRDERFPALVFLAGGIGITPFRSMVQDLHHKALSVEAHLFYANRSLDSAAYHDLFIGLAGQSFFAYIPTLNDEPDAAWRGERRILGMELLQAHLTELDAYAFYLCGPPGLVTDLTAQLQGGGVNKERIFSESFWGYP